MAYMQHYQDAVFPQVHWVQRQLRQNSPDGTYLFVLFPSHRGSNVHEVGKSCLMARRFMGNNGGRFVGISMKVFHYDFDTKTEEACAVFLFPSRNDARTFMETDPNFKQPDFPPSAGHCQAWAVDRAYFPDYEEGFNTYMVSEVRLMNDSAHGVREYKDQFCTPFSELLKRHGAQPYVVQTKDCLGLRRFWKEPRHIVTVHLFKSPRFLEDCMDDSDWATLKAHHKRLAWEMTTVFTVEPRPCP